MRMRRACEDLPPPLRLLADALAGKEPLEVARRAFAPRVVFYMGRMRSRIGADRWIQFVEFLRSHDRLRGLRGVVEEVRSAPGGRVRVRAAWLAERGGAPVRSPSFDVSYRLEGDRVAEIRTAPRNYAFIFGRWSGSLPGFALVYLRFRRWLARGRWGHAPAAAGRPDA